MDKMILDIIAVDHRCAQAVKDAKKKRQDTTADMNSKKKEIYDSFVKEYQVTLDAKKKELQERIDATKKKNEEDYNSSVENITSLYEAHKEEWVASIVDRCKEI